MVDIERIMPENAAVAGPYSPGIKVGNVLYVSGQGSKPGDEDIRAQTETVLENIKAIVEVAGGKVENIVKTTVYLKDIRDFGKMNRTYKKFFMDNGVKENFPARSTMEVANLPLPIMLIEIDAIAVL